MENGTTVNPYVEFICWFGVVEKEVASGKRLSKHRQLKICGVDGSPLYEVGKASVGSGTCRMYLCNKHVEQMKASKFTVVAVKNCIAITG